MKRFCLFAMLAVACASSPPLPPPPPAPAAPFTPSASVSTMTTLPIVQTGAAVLRGHAENVPPEKIATPEFRELVQKMIATMREAPGVGLAAPQVGVPWRLIVLEDRPELIAKLSDLETREREREAFPVRVLVNPVLEPVGQERVMFFEGCLSVKGYMGLVERAREVKVTGLDEHGAAQTWQVRGWPARILQHEVDHIDGTLYIDRMKTRSFTTQEQGKALYGGKPIAEIRSLLGL